MAALLQTGALRGLSATGVWAQGRVGDESHMGTILDIKTGPPINSKGSVTLKEAVQRSQFPR